MCSFLSLFTQTEYTGSELFYSSVCFCENWLISRRYSRRKYCVSFFSAHLYSQSSVVVSSADNLCKQFAGRTKRYCENARMCSLISAFATREENVISFFNAHICPYNLLLVSTAHNLFKQLGPRSGPTISCELSLLEIEEGVIFTSAYFCLIICPFFVGYFIAVGFLV